MSGVLTVQAWLLELYPQYPRLIKTVHNKISKNKSAGISGTFAWEAEPELTPQPVSPDP